MVAAGPINLEQRMNMTRRYLLLLMLAITGAAPFVSRAAEWTEGRNYFRVNAPRATGQPAGVVEVMEVFSYACPACNEFLPIAGKLKASLPANARMVYLPAAFNRAEVWPMFQRAFLTAEALGIAEQTHDAVFGAVWKTSELGVADPATGRLKRVMPTIEDAARWYNGRTGVPVAKFLATAQSVSVDARIREADALIREYQVYRTPTIVVNGKYRLDGQSAGGYPQLIELVKYLVAREAAAPKP